MCVCVRGAPHGRCDCSLQEARPTGDTGAFLERILGQFNAVKGVAAVQQKDKLVFSFCPHEEDVTHMAINARLPLMATSTSYNSVKVCFLSVGRSV